MKTTILLIILGYAKIAFAFEKSRPMVSNIYFANDEVGAVVVVNNDNHFLDAQKQDPLFFILNSSDAKPVKVSKQIFTSKFIKGIEKLSLFNEDDFVFNDSILHQKLSSRSGSTFNIRNSKCKVLNELYGECEELEIEYEKNKETIKLPPQIKGNLVVTGIEKFSDYLLLGAGAEAELELRPRGLFAFNLKTKTLTEFPIFSHKYITLLKIDDDLSHIWVAGSLGVHKLDKDLKVVKACPLIFKEGKESEATISCKQ